MFFFHEVTAPSGPGHPHYRRFTIKQTHHTQYDSSGRMIRPIQRPLLDNTQHSQETDLYAPAVFEPTVPDRERLQTQALDRAPTGIGLCFIQCCGGVLIRP